MKKTAKLEPLAKSALLKLGDEGISIDPLEDWADLMEINELARDAAHPSPGELTDAVLDFPVTAGGVEFRNLTIGARIWLRDVAFRALAADEALCNLAVPYAMANREKLPRLTDSHKIRSAVSKWARKECNRLTDESLMGVLDHFGLLDPGHADEDGDDTEPVEVDEYGNIIAVLTREYGGRPEYWIFEAPPEVVQACMTDIVIKAWYEAEAISKASKGTPGRTASGGLKAVAPDPSSPIVQAQTRFNKRIRSFRNKKQGANV